VPRVFTRFLVVVGCLMAGVPAAVVAATPAGAALAFVVPTSGALFGAFANPGAGNVMQTPATVTSLQASAGRKLDVDRIYSGWSVTQPSLQARWDVANGIIPLISIDPVGPGSPSWSQIAAGMQDPAIIAQAQGLASLHAPVLLSFSHEPERGIYDGTAAGFVAAWRHYVTVVRQYAPNASSVFILSAYQYGLSTLVNWYPGDAYVDWVGADGYNYFGCHGSHWRDFSTIFSSLDGFAVAHDKPAVIAEWASNEDPTTPGHKAAWITAAGQTVQAWPQVRAASYFDAYGPVPSCDWPLTSSASAMQAFAALGAETYFHPRPAVALSMNPTVGPAPLSVSFDTSGTVGTLNPIASWNLDFGDGTRASGSGQPPVSLGHQYAAGDFSPDLSVTDTTGQTNQTTVDDVQTAPPTISNPWANVTSTSEATLGAAVDPNELPTKYEFDWGTGPSLGDSSPATNIGSGTQNVRLTEDLKGLLPGTSYYWHVRASSAAGTVTSPVATFETAGRAPSASDIAAMIDSPTSATLTAGVTPHSVGTQWFFEYGTTASYGSRSPEVSGTAGNGTSPVPVSTRIGPLSVATTYHYALVAVNAVGTTVSLDHVFHTQGPPVIGHESVTRTSTSAQLSVTIDAEGEPTTYRFRWGTSWPLAHSTATRNAGSGKTGLKRTCALSGLVPGTTYHWDVIATNAAGTTSTPGEEFHTP
jgi:hypothetical protein